MIKRAWRIGQAAVLLAACVSATSAFAGTKKFLNEGVWRGEFTVDGEGIPFNFEVKGKDAANAKFSLINGARRDNFIVERVSDDELSVPMNTYDAALVFKIVDGTHIQGEYRDLVPKRKGARNLPFTAEHGKSWRFVEPAKQAAAAVDLNGKWALRQSDDAELRNSNNTNERDNRRNQVGLFKQNGTHLSGVIMTSVGDTRELEGIVQGNRFYLSHFSGPSPRLIKGSVDEDGNLQGSFGSGIYNVSRFEGERNEHVELADPYKLTISRTFC